MHWNPVPSERDRWREALSVAGNLAGLIELGTNCSSGWALAGHVGVSPRLALFAWPKPNAEPAYRALGRQAASRFTLNAGVFLDASTAVAIRELPAHLMQFFPARLGQFECAVYGAEASDPYPLFVIDADAFQTLIAESSPKPEWLIEAEGEGRERASSQTLVKMINAITDMIGRSAFGEIDLVLRGVNPSVLAPEVLVGVLRATLVVRDRLAAWDGLADQVKDECERRQLNARTLMRGLLPS